MSEQLDIDSSFPAFPATGLGRPERERRSVSGARRFLVFAGKRLLLVPIAVLIVVSLSFFLVNLIPSDPVQAKYGGLVSNKDAALLRHQLGLDQSVWHRYWIYLRQLTLHFDLGRSYYTGRTVWSDIWLYLPSTLELVVLAMLLAAVIGIGLGALAAYFGRRVPDHFARGYIAATQAIPDFFLGLLLIFFIFYKLRWAPAPTGQLGLLDPLPPGITNSVIVDSVITGQWALLGSALSHAVLPVMTLAIAYSAYFAKTTRSVLGRALASHQVEFARACGLSEWRVLGYAFRAARTPIITFGGILFAGITGGAAIVETVFAWGGIGQFAVDRILHLDLPEIQGIILVFGLETLLIFVALDILVIFLDPRVSYE